MPMQSVQATKRKRVEAILANGTYGPESGLIQRLQSSLLRLSADDLACLEMIIDLKLKASREEGEA